MQIGTYSLANKLILAPMAGVSDRPFREICQQQGAALTVSEMVASNPIFSKHPKTLLRTDFSAESGLRSVQILGTDPQQMAAAAHLNEQRGAQIIDINMGCPAKKVCLVAAGSALLRDEDLVKRILDQVIAAVSIPVTLKIRTGWDAHSKNALSIAKIAENAGIAALTIHGRTRACKFEGQAEYATIRAVKQHINIPIIANGDIDSPEKAQFVLDTTGADALMIGRAAQGNPWLFKQINHFLETGKTLNKPSISESKQLLMHHLEQLYGFYGSASGVKIARKHIGWYLKNLSQALPLGDSRYLQAQTPAQQQTAVWSLFSLQ
ncbi:MAG: tRNA dihydrouridine synthase DusB [Methylococcales bacterium]